MATTTTTIKTKTYNLISIKYGQIVTIRVTIHNNKMCYNILPNDSSIIDNPVKIFYDESLAFPIILTDATKLYTGDIWKITSARKYDNIVNILGQSKNNFNK
jgi:hypothetical protein